MTEGMTTADWHHAANRELASLETMKRDDPKAFVYRDGIFKKPSQGGPDGAGVIRARELRDQFEALARRADKLVVAA